MRWRLFTPDDRVRQPDPTAEPAEHTPACFTRRTLGENPNGKAIVQPHLVRSFGVHMHKLVPQPPPPSAKAQTEADGVVGPEKVMLRTVVLPSMKIHHYWTQSMEALFERAKRGCLHTAAEMRGNLQCPFQIGNVVDIYTKYNRIQTVLDVSIIGEL